MAYNQKLQIKKMAQSLEALYVKFGLAGSYHESGAKICFP